MADLNLDNLAVFVRVVERGGFAGAARDSRGADVDGEQGNSGASSREPACVCSTAPRGT